MFHVLGFSHDTLDGVHSITAVDGYQCGTGLEPTERDIESLLKKYPAGER